MPWRSCFHDHLSPDFVSSAGVENQINQTESIHSSVLNDIDRRPSFVFECEKCHSSSSIHQFHFATGGFSIGNLAFFQPDIWPSR